MPFENLPAKERKIVQAAAQIFAAKGYDGAAMDAIAAKAGVNKATIYYHLGNKHLLFSRVLSLLIGDMADRLKAAVEGASGPEGRLDGLLSAFAGIFEERPLLPRIMVHEITSGGVHLDKQLAAEFKNVLDVTGGVVKDLGYPQGNGVQPILAHLMIVGSLLFSSLAEPLAEKVYDGEPRPAPAVSPVSMAHMLRTLLLAARRNLSNREGDRS